MPPISSKARYSARCVGVSVDGFREPSTTSPSSRSTSTMSDAFNASYETPDGLIAITPAARSIPLALPQVKVTRPCEGRARLAARTSARSSSSTATTGSDLLVLEVEQLGHAPPAPHVVAQVQDEMVRGTEPQPVVHERLHPALRTDVEVMHLDVGQLGRVEPLAAGDHEPVDLSVQRHQGGRRRRAGDGREHGRQRVVEAADA